MGADGGAGPGAGLGDAALASVLLASLEASALASLEKSLEDDAAVEAGALGGIPGEAKSLLSPAVAAPSAPAELRSFLRVVSCAADAEAEEEDPQAVAVDERRSAEALAAFSAASAAGQTGAVLRKSFPTWRREDGPVPPRLWRERESLKSTAGEAEAARLLPFVGIASTIAKEGDS